MGEAWNVAASSRRPALRKRLSLRAICPAKGKGAALVLPRVDTEMMQLHIKEISRHVANGAHAVLLLDRAKIDVASTAAAQGPRISREGIARESEFFGLAERQSIG
jgi:hypothetical protein